MKLRFVSSTLLMAALCSTLAMAEPADKSLKAWDAVQKKVNQEVEAKLNTMFTERIAKLNKIKDEVYKPGTTVTVRVSSGRTRTVKGLFRRILQRNKQFMVEISEEKLLLSDIDPVNRNRLLFGAKPELLPAYVQEKMKEIETDKARLRKLWRTRGYAEHKYDSIFLATSIVMGDRFYSSDDLGITRMRFSVDTSRDDRPYARFKLLINSQQVEGVVVVTLAGKGIAATTTEFNNPKDANLGKTRLTGYIAKQDLGKDPGNRLMNKLAIHFISFGKYEKAWTVKPREHRSQNTTKTETIKGRKGKVLYRRDRMKFFLVSNSFREFNAESDEFETRKIDILKARQYQEEALEAMATKEPAETPAKEPAETPAKEPAEAPAKEPAEAPAPK